MSLTTILMRVARNAWGADYRPDTFSPDWRAMKLMAQDLGSHKVEEIVTQLASTQHDQPGDLTQGIPRSRQANEVVTSPVERTKGDSRRQEQVVAVLGTTVSLRWRSRWA